MGTKQLAASITTLFLVLQFGFTSPSECAAIEFGFLVHNFDQHIDNPIVLTARVNADDENGADEEDGIESNYPVVDGQPAPEERLLPPVQGGHFQLPSLSARTISMDQIGNGKRPEDFRQDQQINEVALPESGSDRGQPWNWSVVQWEAPNAFSYPLYFEDKMLERHGHIRFGHWQPVASGVRFFSTIPMLPYLITLKSPCDCEYKLGEYRSGSCAPTMIQRPPLEQSAVVAEAIAIGGGIAIFP